jgi:hypothetical protein
MSPGTFQRGLDLGLDAEEIVIPTWSRTKSTPFEVDHVVELQVAPVAMLSWFDGIDNFELLDAPANGRAGPRLQAAIVVERAKQAAFDPALATQVLKFDQVRLADGGSPGETWSVREIQTGEHLDEYERTHPKNE